MSNCTGPIISPPRDDLVLVSPNDRRRTIYTRKRWALKNLKNVSKTTLTSYLFFQRVKCKDPRKFLDGKAQTRCGRDKKWSRTTFAECRCEWTYIFQIWKSNRCIKFSVFMLPKHCLCASLQSTEVFEWNCFKIVFKTHALKRLFWCHVLSRGCTNVLSTYF